MTRRKRLRLIIDIAMTVSMPVLMAYELTGEALHEYLGVIIFVLFVIHHTLNPGWIKGIAKGRYNAARMSVHIYEVQTNQTNTNPQYLVPGQCFVIAKPSYENKSDCKKCTLHYRKSTDLPSISVCVQKSYF